ncbi:MAG: glutamate synthase subunit alpha, partial [Mariniphaga sp.]|nr:glutamate synthase subunit alpha [Mariniphaga sp.]
MKTETDQVRIPEAQGLYNPGNEHDSCGIGFVAHIKGVASHEIIRRGLDVLLNMDHRGALSADNSTGDGAGILIQIPHDFIVNELKMPVGAPGTYGTGLVFLPTDPKEAGLCKEVLAKHIEAEGLTLLGFRDVPVDHSVPGDIAKTTEPAMVQLFVKGYLEKDALERKLYIVRKLAEREIRESTLK